MGGKNHQPCNKPPPSEGGGKPKPGKNYLYHSTKLSRALSQSLALLELANVSLEDVLLWEMEGEDSSSLDLMQEYLTLSIRALEDAEASLSELANLMRERNFKDLPTLHTLDLSSLGVRLSKKAVIDSKSWNEVQTLMERKGFWGMVGYCRTRIQYLHRLTLQLLAAIEELKEAAQFTSVISILEENQPGNIKLEFGRLYTAWHHFNLRFVASSLLSTELWYQHQGFGSLLDKHEVRPKKVATF